MTDIKFYKPVAATFTGTSGAVGSFPAPLPPGSVVSATLTPIGTGYSTIINNTGTLEVELVDDDTAATASPTGMFVAAIYRATLPTYTDGDGGMLHLDSRGRLLVSYGEGGLTADVERDQDAAPAFPAGTFVAMKYESALPTYTAGDAATLHSDVSGRLITTTIDLATGSPLDVDTDQTAGPATPVGQYIVGKREATLPTYAAGETSVFHMDARGRLLVSSVNPATGATVDIDTEDSAGPTNPTGTFPLGLYRATLPTYTDGDAACMHFTSGGLLRVSSSPSLPANSTTSSVAGAGVSTSLLASNSSRLGATFFNDQPTDGTGEILYLLLDAAVASTTNYTVQMAPNTYYEVPFGYTGEIRGIWGAAVGNVRVTELT